MEEKHPCRTSCVIGFVTSAEVSFLVKILFIEKLLLSQKLRYFRRSRLSQKHYKKELSIARYQVTFYAY